MRVNSRVFTEKADLLGGIQIPNCPSQFRGVAERLVMMVSKPGYSVPDYNNVSQLDRILTLHFWKEYDGLDGALSQESFNDWFLSTATSSDMITRARRWLVERNYLLLEPDVLEYAMEASNKWRQSVRH